MTSTKPLVSSSPLCKVASFIKCKANVCLQTDTVRDGFVNCCTKSTLRAICMMPSTPQPSSFRRRPVKAGERTLIESICKDCGTKIVGSVAETLRQDESDHLMRCSAASRLPEHIFVYRTDQHLYVAVCLRCHVCIAASPRVKNVQIAQRQHRCGEPICEGRVSVQPRIGQR